MGRLSCSCPLRAVARPLFWPLDCVRLGASTKWDVAGRPGAAFPAPPLSSLPLEPTPAPFGCLAESELPASVLSCGCR